MTKKIQRFFENESPASPCLVVDLDVVKNNYLTLQNQLPGLEIFYAVKANPAKPILEVLRDLGSNFDAASIYEIGQCLALGIAPERLSFGHTVKKESHIHEAFVSGVRHFAFDSLQELEKLARAAPKSSVFCRFLTPNDGADWPLSDKFGCMPNMVVELLCHAADLGLNPIGVSFHVGSQQRKIGSWEKALEKASKIFDEADSHGIGLSFLNLGGGFPSQYRTPACDLEDYTRIIKSSIKSNFSSDVPRIIVEPGRYISGNAGVIQSEVVLISKKSPEAQKRWVYLDIGKFGGLPEVLDESIQYQIRTPRDGGDTGPVVIAGPTCDEVDVIYDSSDYELPIDLEIGDRVEILSTGAYTASYCSVGFNGFPILKEYYI
jgi:ornithine decarboxylase